MSLLPGASEISGWRVVGTPGFDIAWLGPETDTGCSAAEGGFYLDLSGFHDSRPYGGISQTIATTLGSRYAVSFQIGSSALYDQTNLPCVAVEITGVPTTFYTVSEAGSNRWQRFHFNFTASESNTTLTFKGANTNDVAYIGLDNVVVTRVAETAPQTGSPDSK